MPSDAPLRWAWGIPGARRAAYGEVQDARQRSDDLVWSVVSVAEGRLSVYRRSGLVQSVFWMYDARNDDRVRPSHAAMDGIIFRHDDPIWATHYSPNGWNCRCRVRVLTSEQVRGRAARPRPRQRRCARDGPTGGWGRQADRRGPHQTGKGVPVPGPRRRHTHDDTRRRVGLGAAGVAVVASSPKGDGNHDQQRPNSKSEQLPLKQFPRALATFLGLAPQSPAT